ncbi:MAG: response regulator [Anaerolineales bacterium]|nr:response regulator [Anaerolineales bacterium]
MSNERVLIVEDDLSMVEDIQHKLESAGFIVAGIATSLETAIQQAVETSPDLVLMDTILEGGSDGIEATRQIKVLVDIPVVYLTAHSDPEIYSASGVQPLLDSFSNLFRGGIGNHH